jgi:anti-sigma-K factor RskA
MSICEGNAAPYALGALPAEQRAAFERHLEECAVCREELAALETAAAALPAAAAPLRAPKEVRRRVLAQVRSESPAHRRRLPRGALALAAGAAVIVIVIALALSGARGAGERRLEAQVTPPGAHVVLEIGGGRTVISLSGMPSPGAGRVYEVWTKAGSGAPRATSALFGVTHAGAATTALSGEARGTSEILVSSEPAGGSLAPTRTPVIVARL